jgi:hypothetical protein
MENAKIELLVILVLVVAIRSSYVKEHTETINICNNKSQFFEIFLNIWSR